VPLTFPLVGLQLVSKMVRPRKKTQAPAVAPIPASKIIDEIVEQREATEPKLEPKDTEPKLVTSCDSDIEQESPVVAGDPPDANVEKSATDMHAERRVMGAAATVCGAAGALTLGPVSGVVLGAAALYAATREDSSGSLARKVGSMYLQASDLAVDAGLQAMDQGVKKAAQMAETGCQRLSREVDLSTLPAPVRSTVCAALNSQARPAQSSAQVSEEARKIREKYPDRVPIICERSPYSTDLPEMSKRKFIVAGTMLCGEFKYMVHKHLAQALTSPEQTIYIFVNGLAPKTNTPMSELYDRLRAEDGFLYVKYGAENTLG